MADKKKSIFTEFKEFISKGNVIDMAVGVIIGGAFTKIVNSVVSDLIMPALGPLTGNIDFAALKIVLAEAVMGEDGTVVKEELAIRYGMFLDALINFLLIAVCVFALVKIVNGIRAKAEKLKKKEEEEAPPAPAPEPAADIVLLTEIRDLLKKQDAELKN